MHKTILILEDNLLVLSKLLARLNKLEQDQPYSLSVMALTNYKQVKDFINNNEKAKFDIILLDRDCKLNRSFHVLELEKFKSSEIIAISSVPEYNKLAKQRGAKIIIEKDFADIDKFVGKVVREIEKIIAPSWLKKFFKNLTF